MKPNRLFIIGGILVVIGFIVPFLYVINKAAIPIWLGLVIGAIQMLGLMSGIIGSVIYVKEKRDKGDR